MAGRSSGSRRHQGGAWSPRAALRAVILLPLLALIGGGCVPEASDSSPGTSNVAEVQNAPQRRPTRTGLVQGSGEGKMAWAEGSEGLITGLDGELYEAYHPVTVEHTQKALQQRGLYAGPINGVLDLPTMRAIYAFQESSYGLQHCGIPTPRTRQLLEQGSHT